MISRKQSLGLLLLAVPLSYIGCINWSTKTNTDLDQIQPKLEKHTNSIGMTFVRVNPGTFRMGFDTKLNVNHLTMFYPDYLVEFNIRETTITTPFWLAEYEVTKEHFQRFVSDTEYQTDNERLSRSYTWREIGFPVGDQEPVVGISWNDAVRFCEWLSEKEGQIYRLPTEAEWEYSCRAGTDTLFSFGNDPGLMPKYGNIADQTLYNAAASNSKPDYSADRYSSQSDGFSYLAPVGSFLPNRFGLYDMHGNAFEYCADYYEVLLDLDDSTDPRGPGKDDVNVIRGGSWNFGEALATSFFRISLPSDHGLSRVGFRVLLEERPMSKPDLDK